MDKLKLVGYFVLAAVIGAGLGYYYAPDKVRIQEKIVEKTKIIKQEDKKITEKFDPSTGKIVERIEETKNKETSVNQTDKEKTKETLKTKKSYALKGGVAVPLDDFNKQIPRVGAEIRLPFFNSWAGLEADVDMKSPKLGAYLRLEF